MPSFVDIVGHPKVTNDPTNQLADSPAGVLDKGIGDAAGPIGAIPGYSLSQLGNIFTDPAAYQDWINQQHEAFQAGLKSLTDWLDTIPVIGPLVEAITGLSGAGLNMTDINSYFSNLEAMLGFPNLADSGTTVGFNAQQQIDNFIDQMLGPSGKLATLTGGLLSALNIPGLDASQIVSGLFPQSMVNNLEADLATINQELANVGSDWSGLVQAFISGDTTGTQADFNDLIKNLLDLLGMPNLLPPGTFDPVNAATSALESVWTPAGALTSWSSLPSNMWSGLSPFTTQNLLPDGSFDETNSLDGAGIWTRDVTVDHTGRAGSGSATVTANGDTQQLIGVPISCTANQPVAVGAHVKWQNLTAGAGNTLSLAVNAYDAADNLISDVSHRVVQTVIAPGATSAGWSGVDQNGQTLTAVNTWVSLAGTYQTPAGTASVRIVLEVEAVVTAGQAWFDDCALMIPLIDAALLGNMPNIPAIQQQSIQGLTELWQAWFGTTNPTTSSQLLTAAVQDLDSAFNNLFGLGSDPTTSTLHLGVIPTLPQNYIQNLESDLSNAVTYGDWDPLLSALFGGSSVQSTIQVGAVPAGVPATKIANVLGGADLGADLTAVHTTTTSHDNWFSQILSQLGLTGGTGTGTNIGTAIGTAQSTASGASSAASAAQGTANAANNLAGTNQTNISNTWGWLFGTTNPNSSSNILNNKIAAALGQGSIGADLQALGQLFFGAHTVGSAVLPAALPNIPAGSGPGQSSDLLSHLTNVAAQGGPGGANPVAAALAALQTQTNTLTSVASQIQQQQTQAAGAANSGQSFFIYFPSYANWAAVPVNTTYGTIPGQVGSHGSGQFIINNNGYAAWSPVNNGDVSGVGIYNGNGGQAYTDTVYQKINASLAGLPNGGNARNFVLSRANAITNPTDYVYGVVYLNTSFQLIWELGCYIGGVQHIWGTGTVSTINLNFTFYAGVGNNANRYQGYSGDQLVFDHTNIASDPGGVFPVDLSHRYWGFRSDTYNNGQNYPAPAAYVGCADNIPPTIPGVGMRMYRTNTALVSCPINMDTYDFFNQSNFFDAISEQSNGIRQLTTDIGSAFGTSEPIIQLDNAGRYIISMRVIIGNMNTSSGAVSIFPAIIRYNSAGAEQERRVFGTPAFGVNGFGGQYNAGAFGGTEVIGCQAGDLLMACYYLSSGSNSSGGGLGALASPFNLTGEATGARTYFEATLANWSFS